MTHADLILPGRGHGLHDRLADARSRAPVVWSEAHRAWVALSHAAVTEGFRDPRLSSERLPAFERLAVARPAAFRTVVDLLSGWMVFRDPPVHTRLREPVRAAFTPRRVAQLEGVVQRITDDLLDHLDAQGSGELLEMVAQPLPAIVIAELLGVPPSDRLVFQRWSSELSHLVFAASSENLDHDAAIAGATSFAAYFGDLVDHYRANPADNLISAIVDAGAEGDAGLSPAEVVGACAMLLFAGHSTTTGFIANALWSLFEHGDTLAELQADAVGALDQTAVDELMRFEGPASVMIRRADIDFGWFGVHVRAGDAVYLSISSANRDPAVFDRPDRLDLRRRPNPQLGFGWGLHHCLGAPLARLETQVVLRTLLRRFPDLEPIGQPAWADSVLGHGAGLMRVRV